MSFSLGRLINNLESGDDNPSMSTALSREDVTNLVNDAMQRFRRDSRYVELLSVFDQQKLWSLLGLQLAEDDGKHEKMLGEAIERADKLAVLKIVSASLAFALYALLQNPRSEIHDIMVTDGFSPEAEAEYLSLRKRYDRPAQSASVDAPKVIDVHEVVDPIDQCVADFNGGLPMSKFKAKYMDDSRLRPVFDAAVAQGRI